MSSASTGIWRYRAGSQAGQGEDQPDLADQHPFEIVPPRVLPLQEGSGIDRETHEIKPGTTQHAKLAQPDTAQAA